MLQFIIGAKYLSNEPSHFLDACHSVAALSEVGDSTPVLCTLPVKKPGLYQRTEHLSRYESAWMRCNQPIGHCWILYTFRQPECVTNGLELC